MSSVRAWLYSCNTACAQKRVTLLLFAIVFSLAEGDINACGESKGGTIVTVRAFVPLATLRQVNEAELLDRFSRALTHRLPLSIQQHSIPVHGTSVLSANVGVGSLQVKRYVAEIRNKFSLFGNVSIDILGCGLEPRFVNETLASTAQLALGGASIHWATSPLHVNHLRKETGKQFASTLETDAFLPQRELVAEYSSPFSKAAIWRTGHEVQLVLNDIIMSDTRDERIYHEMLVQPALLVAEKTHRVLIIGGGEGAVLREVLRDDRVEHITMVEIDEGLVNFCRAHLGAMHEGSFDSSKVELRFEEGAAFARRAPNATYDIVIVDGIDFGSGDVASYGNSLYSDSFYSDVFRILNIGGVLAQYMSDVDVMAQLPAIGFRDVQKLGVDIPSFYGAGARFMLAAKGQPESIRNRLLRRVSDTLANSGWSYFSAEALALGLNHSARCLKGYNPDLEGAADMDEVGYICFFTFMTLYTLVGVIALLWYRKMCCFKNCHRCHSVEHHPVVQAKHGEDSERVEVRIPANCGPGTLLRILHPSNGSYFHMTIPHFAHPGKVLQVHPEKHKEEFEAALEEEEQDPMVIGQKASIASVLKANTSAICDTAFSMQNSQRSNTPMKPPPSVVTRDETGNF